MEQSKPVQPGAQRHVFGADAKNMDIAGTLQNLGAAYKQCGTLDVAATGGLWQVLHSAKVEPVLRGYFSMSFWYGCCSTIVIRDNDLFAGKS